MIRDQVFALIDPERDMFVNTREANTEHAVWRFFGFDTDEKVEEAKVAGWRVLIVGVVERGPQ